jgi:hypothetical protein
MSSPVSFDRRLISSASFFNSSEVIFKLSEKF